MKAPLAVSVIKKRADFLAMRQGIRAHSPSFLLLHRENTENQQKARIGFTVTKKLGGAVIRNRIRRRLKAAAKEVFPRHSMAGQDYVLIARPAAYDRKYTSLLDDMKRALLRLHKNTK